MHRTIPQLVVVLLLAAILQQAHAGEVIDRIVAIVNGHVVLQSDWDDALSFEAFSQGRALSQVSEQDRIASLDRLIDQELLREQIPADQLEKSPPEEVQTKIQEMRSQHPDVKSDADWQALLASYGLDEKRLETRVAEELGILHQIDVRLRPSVQVDASSIEDYYKNTFLPQMHKAGAADVPLAEVSARIREILTQEKINELFTSWMQTLRNESKIRTTVQTAHAGTTGGRE